MIARYEIHFTFFCDEFEFGADDRESGRGDGDELQISTVVEDELFKDEESSNGRPLRGKLWGRFEEHLGYLETRDDYLNLFDRVFVIFCGHNICPVQIDNKGREEKWSGDEDESLNHFWQRFKRAVGRVSAGRVNDVSKLKEAAKPDPRGGQLCIKMCVRTQRSYKRE